MKIIAIIVLGVYSALMLWLTGRNKTTDFGMATGFLAALIALVLLLSGCGGYPGYYPQGVVYTGGYLPTNDYLTNMRILQAQQDRSRQNFLLQQQNDILMQGVLK